MSISGPRDFFRQGLWEGEAAGLRGLPLRFLRILIRWVCANTAGLLRVSQGASDPVVTDRVE